MLVLDGGGTSLKIWQITQAGKWQLVRRIRGNFNAHLFSAKQLAKTIATLPELQKTHSVLIGLAGLSDKSAQHALTHTLASTKALRGKALRVVSDWELQLERSFPNQDGIVVMLGTGSVFAARVGRRTVRIGGYGRWIGDAGSGWAIGIAALEKYLRLLDGFFVDEVFQNAMRKHFKS
ncbi:MAG: hypothetical protein RML35_11790 [Chloroherpetonaceae bacterium]|nr:hypothetical protein [Chloroherpetonaceae bacterium]